MIADARINSFSVIIPRHVASLLRRVRGSSNSYLKLFAERMDLDCPINAELGMDINSCNCKCKPKIRFIDKDSTLRDYE